MSSVIKVNTIQDAGGNTILSSNGTGTFTSNLPNNTPAFEAYLSSNQDVGYTGVATKIQFDTERFDTDSYYDNATNYRFTPLIAGKYFVYTRIFFETSSASNSGMNLSELNTSIYKNGSQASRSMYDAVTRYFKQLTLTSTNVIDMNGTTDYLEIYVSANSNLAGSTTVRSNSTEGSIFGAYKIIE